ncbi:hypothetical protein LX36DRAFT_696740 [Colletotrichum falcatum]|nr:hypothetical protein LX36DRAFT_696740 [Colletotrichum falcatum]
MTCDFSGLHVDGMTSTDATQLPAGGDELLQHHMQWLVRRRCHLPMISSKVDIWILVLGFPDYDGGYPWSKVFTQDLSHKRHPALSQNQKYDHGRTNTNIVDPSTSSIADIKRRICFEVPQEIDTRYVRDNLLAQGNVPYWTIRGLCKNQKFSQAQMNRLQQAPTVAERNALATLYRAGAVSALKFAQESTAFAEAFGDFLLHDNPKGVAGFGFLTTLRNQALRRAEEKQTAQLKYEDEQRSSEHSARTANQPLRRAEDKQTPQLKHEDEPAIGTDPDEQRSSEHSVLTPLVVRQGIWTALCPSRKCVGGFPFEVPVPPTAMLQEHVIDELEDEAGRGADTVRREGGRLANYIHPHVRIDAAQRRLQDGRSVPVLVLGLAEHAYNLRFSRLGLLQAYDMVVCWASRVDSDGASVSLTSAFDGCNKITEGIVASQGRIDEMAGLERRLERFMPDISRFDEVVDRISRWMERHKAKLVSSPEGRERRLGKWCKKHGLGDMGGDLLEQTCQQAVEAKIKEWEESKRRAERAGFDDTDVARPKKKRRMR